MGEIYDLSRDQGDLEAEDGNTEDHRYLTDLGLDKSAPRLKKYHCVTLVVE